MTISGMDAWGYHFPQSKEEMDSNKVSVNIYNAIGSFPGPSIGSGIVRLIMTYRGEHMLAKQKFDPQSKENWKAFIKQNKIRAFSEIACGGFLFIIPDIVITVKRHEKRKGYTPISP